MNFITVMNQGIIIFIIIIIGYICKKLKMVTREITKGITEIILNLAIPATVLYSFNQDIPKSEITNALYIFIIAVLGHGICALLSKFLYKRYTKGTSAVMSFITVFTNCAFMGYPVMANIYGDIGVFYAAVYGMVYNLYVWTYGQMLFTGVSDMKAVKKAILNPGTISVFIGLILLLSPIKLPGIIEEVAGMVGGMTTPLAMIVIGSMLAEVKFREMFRGVQLYYGTVLRLVILPVATFFVLKLIGFNGTVLGVSTLLVAMPAASNAVMFAEKFDGDSILASKIVVFSTALSIFTIPLIAIFVV